MSTDVEIVRDDDLRTKARKLHRSLGSALGGLAETLYRIQTTRAYEEWGYKHFAQYVIDDLEMPAKVAYQCVEVYRHFVQVWDAAATLPFNRLLEAAPLVKQGKRRPADLVEQLKEPKATVRAIRAWKDRELRADMPESSMPAGDGDTPPREGPSNWLRLHQDMVLKDRRRFNGVEWAEVALSLPLPVLTMFVETLELARVMLGLTRDPADDRATIQHELEALCQEVSVEWKARIAHEEER